MKPEDFSKKTPEGNFLLKHKKTLILALTVVLVLGAAAAAFLLWPKTDGNKIPVTSQVDITPTSKPGIPANLKTLKVREEPAAKVGFELIKPFELVPEVSDETGTATDSGYRILLDSYDYTAQQLSGMITITPQTAFVINQSAKGEFILQPTPLQPNQLYSISFSDPDKGLSYSWAFQTRREFFVTKTLPRDKATYVPVNAGIEVTFSQKVESDLSAFFEISPHVPGRFEIFKDTVVFIPAKLLEHDTIYTVTVKKGFAAKEGGMALKEDVTFAFQTDPKSLGEGTGYSCESFEFARRIYNFYPYEEPLLSVYTNIEQDVEVEFELYRYSREEEFKEDIFTKDDRPYWCVHYDKPISYEGKERVLNMNTTFLSDGDDSYYRTKFIQIPQTLPEGHYIAVIRKGQQERSALVQINAMAVYVGSADNKTIAMIYESETATPIAGAQIAFDAFTMQTGKDGLAVSDKALLTEESFRIKNYAIHREGHPSYYATLGTSYYSSNYYYYEGEGYYGSNFYAGEISDLYWGYLFTDRDMYMPSDTVNIWGMVAGKDGSTVPEKVRIVLTRGYSWYYINDEYADIDEIEVPLTGTNTFKASFAYENLSQGYYNIEVYSGDKLLLSKDISVNPYVKPIYTLNSSLSQRNVMLGDKVEFTMETKFFEGTPVNGMNFNYYLSGLSTPENSGTLTTDENGKASLTFEAMLNENSWYPRSAHVQISNADPEETSVNTYESFTIFPRDTMIKVENETLDDEATGKKTSTVQIFANRIEIDKIRNKDWYYQDDYKGAPANIKMEVELYETWYTRRQTGTYYNFITKQTYPKYEYDRHENKFQVLQLTTVDGKASFDFTREDGKSYHAILRCADSKGKQIVQQEYLYEYRFDYNDYDWRSIDYYNIERDKEVYSVNEQAKLTLYKGDTPVTQQENRKVLFMLFRKGLLDYALTDDPAWQVQFREEYIPNAGVKAVYFDGKNFKESSWRYLVFDQEDRKLNISVTPSKPEYRPGETAIFDVQVTDPEGKGRKAEVLFSVVDEAFFALREQTVNLLSSIYGQFVSLGYNGGSIPHTNTLEDYDYFNGAECGEGGDEGTGDVRSDFRDTATFESIQTDENGHGQLTVLLPDNLTQWRVTYLGITEDLYAEDGTIPVNVRLPYFINTVFNTKFIAGDQPVLQMRSFGTEVSDNGQVKYTVRIERDGVLWQEASVNAPAGQRAYVLLNPLSEGNYTYTVRGKYKSFEDAIQLPFEVVPGFVEQTLTDYQTLSDSTTVFTGTRWPAKVYFFNENVKEYWNELLDLAYSHNNRIDSIVVRKQARRLLKEFFKDTSVKDRDEYDISRYQLQNGGIALLPYDSADPVLTAKICAIGDNSFDIDIMKQYFYRTISAQDATSTHVAAAYWGLACLREPVLLDLNELIKDEQLLLIDRLYIALAYAYAGDIDTAGGIYRDIVQSYMKQDSLRAYITIEDEGYDSDDIQEATSLCALLAQKVNGVERDKFFKFVTNQYSTNILTSALRLTCIKSNLKSLSLESSFTWTLDGKQETVTLKGRDTYSMFLTAEKLEKIRFSDVKGKITVSTVYDAPLGETAQTDSRITIERTYTNREQKNTTTFETSDYVKVTLRIRFSPTAPSGRYMVEDCLPASLRYVYSHDEANQWVDGTMVWYPHEISGQKVSFCVYHWNTDKTPVKTITYFARVINSGEYTADHASAYNLDSNVINYSPRVRITVK